jgi:hypothetical protein
LSKQKVRFARQFPPRTGGKELDAERELIEAANHARIEIGVFAGKIAREARSAGVTLALGTQKLSAKMLDTIPGAGDLKVNLSRVLLGKTSRGERMSALRDPDDTPDLNGIVPRGPRPVGNVLQRRATSGIEMQTVDGRH